MTSKVKISKLVYWSIGLITIIWINVENYIYGGEGAYFLLFLILLIGLPSSLAAYILSFYLLSSAPLNHIDSSFVVTNIIALFSLLVGHFQWFYFFARIVSNEGDDEEIMRNVRNLNTAGLDKSNKPNSHGKI